MMVLDLRVSTKTEKNVIIIEQLDADKVKQQLLEAFSLWFLLDADNFKQQLRQAFSLWFLLDADNFKQQLRQALSL